MPFVLRIVSASLPPADDDACTQSCTRQPAMVKVVAFVARPLMSGLNEQMCQVTVHRGVKGGMKRDRPTRAVTEVTQC